MARYILVWLALLVFTAVTVLVAKTVDLGAGSLAIAMLIAVIKGSLVALFFMHLWDHPASYRVVLAVSLMFVFVLIALINADVHTRFPLARPMVPLVGAQHEARPEIRSTTHKGQSEP